MKSVFLITFLFFACFASSQDTIVYKNSSKVPVILKEITPVEIRYQRPGMTDGPDYVINRSEVDRIIYRNGITEILQAPSEAKTTTEEPSVISYNRKITYRDAQKNYNFIRQLALSHPDLKKQQDLLLLTGDIRQHKNVQNGTRTGAIICGGLAIGGTFLYGLALLTRNNDPAFYVPPAVLGGVAMALGSVSIVYSVRVKDKRKEFVDLYNE